MRIAQVRFDGDRRTAIIEDACAVVLEPGAPDADDYVRDSEEVGSHLRRLRSRGKSVDIASLHLLPPLRRFNRDILATGWNYWDHFEESKGKREGQDPDQAPEHPVFFTKGPNTVVGPRDDLVIDHVLSSKWDYEVELAVVIHRTGRSIPVDRAWEHIGGFLVANDVSQRDLQRAHGGQWLKGKSIDGCLPMGPWLTTTDDVDDVASLHLEFELNGKRLQDALVAQQAFDIPTLLAELSRGQTLHAGDVLLTGTPSGVGNAREPQVFLRPGDRLVSRVSGLGELINHAVAGVLTAYHQEGHGHD